MIYLIQIHYNGDDAFCCVGLPSLNVRNGRRVCPVQIARTSIFLCVYVCVYVCVCVCVCVLNLKVLLVIYSV